MKNFYVTSPIYYVNDVPHIGHAYTNLACDVLARFMRLDGYNVKFLTGTDEHGQKVEKSAIKKNMSPQDFTDQVSQRFRDLNIAMNFSNDDFIRTTEARHKKAAQYFWNKLIDNGHIYLDSYAGWYSVRDEAFYAESELIDGKAPTGAEVEWLEEPSYFFNLSKWQDKLLKFYDENPDFIQPESRRNEVINFVKSGLQDLSVSRVSFKWGVPVPNDDKHVMYVWLDALTNYISALGYPEKTEDFQNFWPANVHMVGKDITRFHAIYWPAFLMAAEIELPKTIMAHGWWTNEGQKISKSVGNVIDPFTLIEEFGVDQTRYFFMREIPFGNDGNFSREAFINRVNADLANNIGNLAQRVLSFINKNCDAKIPELNDVSIEELYKNELFAQAKQTIEQVRKAMQSYKFNQSLEAIISLATQINVFIDHEAPWSLKKTDPAKMKQILYQALELIRYLAIMLQPITPSIAAKLLDLLAIDKNQRQLKHLHVDYALQPLTALPKPEALIPRIAE